MSGDASAESFPLTKKVILKIPHTWGNIADKLSSELAKVNITDFICEMAFLNPSVDGVKSSQAITVNKSYLAGQIIKSADVVENKNLKDFVSTLETELELQGVFKEYILSFAAYLCAAYKNKILLLLAGSNGRDIAGVFD